MIKKILKATGIIVLLIIIIAIAIPYFFKDRIIEIVKTEINNNVNAKVNFEDVNLSLIKSFPDFNLSLEQLTVTGINEFENYSLIESKNIEFSLDLMSVISSEKPIQINKIYCDNPKVNIIVLQNEKANYDIMKTESPNNEEEHGAQNLSINLEKYEIKDGQIVYDDRLNATYLEIKRLDHIGSGNFSEDIFDIKTSTKIGNLSAKSAGISYLNKAKAAIDITLNADIPNSKFTIKDNSVLVNELKINTEGFIQMVDEKIDIDIKYDVPKNKFKNLLSMIPSAYTENFDSVEANGLFELNGYIKGAYDQNSESLPSFLINLKIDNGDFKYPNLPMGINGISTTSSIYSPTDDLDEMIVDISDFKMILGNNPFEADIKLWTLLSDPNIDSKINGTIDLAELAKAFPMEGISTLNGIITSNINAKTSMSAIDGQDIENIKMSGNLAIDKLSYKADQMPLIQIDAIRLNFTPKNVNLEKFEGQFGQSDIQAEGEIDNILAYFSPDKTMTGELKMRSKFFDANEWITEDEDSVRPTIESENTIEEQMFDRFDFTIDGEIEKLIYDEYELKESKLIGHLTSNEVNIQTLSTNIGESDFKMNGTLNNILGYVSENGILNGVIKLNSTYINANEFMTEDESSVEELAVFPVPENMNLNIDANIKKVLYTNIPLTNIDGKIEVKNEIATIKDCLANTMGGNVIMNGSYNTQDVENPDFTMDYIVSNLNYQDAFNKLNTFQALSPIGKFIEGKFNTTLKMSGKLGKDMLPDLNSLSADGFLQTLDGTLKNFKPVEELADKLNINSLKSINLKNTKNWFELNNGEVTIKDFDLKTNGIDMVIGGTHGLDSEMNYNIKAKIPREVLSKTTVGQATDKGLSFLQNQATKLGINIDQSEFVNINAVISGSMMDPKIKLNLLGVNGKNAAVDQVVDKIKEEAIDKVSDLVEDKVGVDITNIDEEIEEVKEDLSAKADAEIAALMEKTTKSIQKINDEAEKRSNQTKLEAKKLSERTKLEGYKQADLLIEKAGSNIFKKKAAEIAANKLKQETDKKAAQIIDKGDSTALEIINEADKQTNKLQAKADEQAKKIRDKYKQ